MRVNIDCSLILLLLSGMLALLKIGGQFPYSWIWVIAPIWIPLLALAGITIILIIAWIIGVIGVLILEMHISGKTNNISYAHTNDGGADLRSNEDTIICAGSQTLVHTGVRLAIPAGYVGLVCPRSGLALKHNITVMNAPGVIDANYRGEVCVILRNMDEQAFEIHEGDRIAQIVFLPYAHMQFEPVTELDSTERGENGFGSTGK